MRVLAPDRWGSGAVLVVERLELVLLAVENEETASRRATVIEPEGRRILKYRQGRPGAVWVLEMVGERVRAENLAPWRIGAPEGMGIDAAKAA